MFYSKAIPVAKQKTDESLLLWIPNWFIDLPSKPVNSEISQISASLILQLLAHLLFVTS